MKENCSQRDLLRDEFLDYDANENEESGCKEKNKQNNPESVNSCVPICDLRHQANPTVAEKNRQKCSNSAYFRRRSAEKFGAQKGAEPCIHEKLFDSA